MCVVVTKITETRICAAKLYYYAGTSRSEFACRAAVTGHEVSSNCRCFKKRSKTTGTNLLYNKHTVDRSTIMK